MIAFERRQHILRLLQEQPGIRVSELATILDVSEGTVRNDLDVLEQEDRVRRVRGGAVLNEPHRIQNGQRPFVPEYNNKAIKYIARWAADMVETGDTILLDASEIAHAMVPHLQEQRGLTIVTNGLNIARLLAADLSNTVILVGGVLRGDGQATAGTIGASMLAGLHIRTAFVSGAGFSVDRGLMAGNLQEAELKRQMLASASNVVALVEAQSMVKQGLTVFAPPERIDHLFTDTGVDPAVLEQLRQLDCQLTICGENTVTTFAPRRAQTTYKLGFANLSEEIPFAVDVRRGLERAVKQRSNIDLVMADNRLSGDRALQIADNFIAKGVNLVIEYQIDARMGTLLMNKYQQAGIPVVAVDIPMVGATYFGVNNFHSGHLAGVALGRWIQQHWDGHFDRLLVLEEPRAGALPEARMQGQLRGLEEILGPVGDDKKVILNSGNTSSTSEAAVYRALLELPEVHCLAVICFNDDAALGALRAARRLNREEDLAIVGQGADRLVREEIRTGRSRIIGSTAFMPERYGDMLLELAARILNADSVPPAVYMDHVFIDQSNIEIYYPAA